MKTKITLAMACFIGFVLCLRLLSHPFDEGFAHAVGFIKKLAEKEVQVVKPFESGK